MTICYIGHGDGREEVLYKGASRPEDSSVPSELRIKAGNQNRSNFHSNVLRSSQALLVLMLAEQLQREKVFKLNLRGEG